MLRFSELIFGQVPTYRQFRFLVKWSLNRLLQDELVIGHVAEISGFKPLTKMPDAVTYFEEVWHCGS
jgi:hypothetical protein